MKLRILATVFASATMLCSAFAFGQGKIISLEYKASMDLYPGTERNVKVYIPEQYEGKEPACLFIGLDGITCNAPKVFDKLIAEGKMPVTIGIFVQPGVIRGKDGNVIRYNRSNEFDFTDGRFAEFLDTEIVPFVEKETGVKVSKNPDQRAIFGLSSGGIAAFNAAWMRPDLFRRVYSGVGTFVSMRGGNDLQVFVRKCEPKPLRICLQDGSQDVWNATFGHWYEANQMLSTALDFAGYDTKYDWSDEKHSGNRAAVIFEEVMIWLWGGYPEPVKAGITQNDFLNKYLYRDGEKTPFKPLSVSGQDQWVKEKEIDRTAPFAFTIEDIAQGQRARKSNRRTYYCAVYPDDSFTALEKSFFYNETETNCLWQAVNGENSPHIYDQRFYWLHSYGNTLVSKGPMVFDSKGNLFVLTDIGIQVCDQNGRVRFILEIPDQVRDALLEDNGPHLPELLPDGGSKEYERRLLTMYIAEGKIIITDRTSFTYSRELNISPAVKGQRPKSQGQG